MYISVHFFTIQHTLYSFHMAYFLLVCVVSKSMNYATIGASYMTPSLPCSIKGNATFTSLITTNVFDSCSAIDDHTVICKLFNDRQQLLFWSFVKLRLVSGGKMFITFTNVTLVLCPRPISLNAETSLTLTSN